MDSCRERRLNKPILLKCGVMIGPTKSEELINFWYGDALPDTDSGSLWVEIRRPGGGFRSMSSLIVDVDTEAVQTTTVSCVLVRSAGL